MKLVFCLLLLSLSASLSWASASTSLGIDKLGSVHHDLAVTLDPATLELRGDDTITLSGRDELRFALPPEFTLDQLSLDEREIPLASPQTNPQQGLSWHSLKFPGDKATHRIRLRYHATLTALDASMDHREVLGYLPAMSSPAGSYLPAGAWYPQLEAESTFTYRVTLELPDEQRGIVPGRLISEKSEAGRYLAQFEFPHPADGIELFVAPYQIKELFVTGADGKKLRLRTYFHPEIADLAAGYLDSISSFIDLYTDWIGAYPYSEFSIVSSPLPTGFGLPTLTYLGIDVLRLPFIRSGSLGHEVLHNWWANGVFVDWQQGNWSEGLTTFMADYTYAERASTDAARAMRLSWLRDFAAIPEGQDLPLRQFTSRSHSSSQIVGYHKSAYLFLMLRDLLGTEIFDTAIRRIWKERQFRTTSWADLEQVFEASAGRKLDAFFAQWLSRQGAANLKLSAVSLRETRADKPHRLEFTLEQEGEPYALRVPVVITTAQGKQEHIVELSTQRESYILESDALPISLALDPDFRLFRQLSSQEIPPILRQVVTDPSAVTIIPNPMAEMRDTAEQLASKMLDSPPRLLDATVLPAAPLLLIGTHDEVDDFLKLHSLPARPASLKNNGTAQVWALPQPNGKVIVVVSIDNLAALQALLRPLPHYGKESFLVFENNKVIDKGIWPAPGSEWVVTEQRP